MTAEFAMIGDPVVYSPPSAALCRVSGYVIDHLGRPKKGLRVRVSNSDTPAVTPDYAVFGEQVDVISDQNGFVQFDLLRSGTVQILFADRGRQSHEVHVPDAATASLWDLVYPYLASAELAIADAVLAVGESSTAIVTGTFSDGRTLDVSSYSALSSASPAVATVSGCSVTGVAAGAAAISVASVDTASLYAGPPTGFETSLQDQHQEPYTRLTPAEVDLGDPVSVTVS